MFNLDHRKLQELAPFVERVLIVDPNMASWRIISDLMKDMGARRIAHATTTLRAMELLLELEPQIVFTELAGESLDGLNFTRHLRRSVSPSRRAPVIMATATATAGTILGARDSGVHEFLRKPFTGGDLFRRVENVITKYRPWVEANAYVGPDRRRFNSGEYAGPKKRGVDKGVPQPFELA